MSASSGGGGGIPASGGWGGIPGGIPSSPANKGHRRNQSSAGSDALSELTADFLAMSGVKGSKPGGALTTGNTGPGAPMRG